MSVVDDFGVPAHVRGDIAQGLYGSHVGNEIAVLVAEEIVVACSVDEGKPSNSALSQQVVKDPRFSLVEIVVDHSNGDVLEVGGAEELAQTHVNTGRNGVGGVGAPLPPVAAHEEEGEDDDAAPDHRAEQTHHVHGLHLHPSHRDIRIDESLALSVS
jgi:hypothetical protein